MEELKTHEISLSKASFYEKVVLKFLARFKRGNLTLTLPNNQIVNIGDQPGLTVDMKIHSYEFFRRVFLYGDIGFGESYCDGEWSTSNLTNLVRWGIQNVENSGVLSGSVSKQVSINLLEKINKIEHIFKRNSKTGSKSNISYHYDLSNDFYQLMLDKTMSYSCGIFADESVSLYEGQVHKLKNICNDLDIKSSDHILEIGCGWGSFAIFAATNFGCRITGITISNEQFKFITDKVKSLGLEDKITILLKDYRDLQGSFDKVVSVEMIEAVGHEYLPEYFETIDRLLKPEGVAVIQAITSPDSRYNSFRKGVDFIQKHIFPGSLLPSVGAMVNACKNTKLQIHNLRDIGPHYARTLELWRNRVFENREAIKKLGMDETFFRKWEYYLCYCEGAFAERNISDVQVTFIKPNNTSYKM